MNKQTIIVPKGINYISNWSGFNLIQGHYIIDKKVTGCGFTQYCITNNLPIILCSPRKILLENKSDQHPHVFYVKNDLEKSLGVDCDLTCKLPQKSTKSKQFKKMYDEMFGEKSPDMGEGILELMDKIKNYVYFECFNKNNPPKILVTYDSLKHVIAALGIDTINKFFYVVVDEFQSIFTDSRFKGTIEMNFLSYLQDCKNVCYVSATPMMEKYLDELDEFKNLPYYELDWSTEDIRRVINPNIEVKYTKTPIKEICTIIQTYLDGNFEVAIGKDDRGNNIPIESKEIVFYVNSVRMICTVLKKMGLTTNNTNVLCARTNSNIERLRKVKHEIGSVPLQDQPHKMFTFCTRTVYLGSDFYSTSARSVIVSDSNIECMAVDIQLDLPQILGRQRLNCNPWKNRALMFCKTTRKQMPQNLLDETISNKINETNNSLFIYNNLGTTSLQDTQKRLVRTEIVASHYESDYVSMSEKTNSPVFNNLVLVAEKRAFEVIQKDYKDWVCVLNRIDSTGITSTKVNNTPLELEVNTFLQKFNQIFEFSPKMKFYCESYLSDDARNLIDTEIPIEYSKFYKYLGPSICKANSYKRSDLLQRFKERYLKEQKSLNLEIQAQFSIKEDPIFYTLKSIKEILSELYKNLGIQKTAKATDILDYFEVSESIRRIDGKATKGYYLLSIKKS